MRLRYTLPALADLSVILDYIAVHSPQGARRVQARIQDLTDLRYDILTSDAARAIRRFAG